MDIRDDTMTMPTIADVQGEVSMLKDLFQRRLLDDKGKAQTIAELTRKLDGRFMLPLFRELILLLDRIEAFTPMPHDVASDEAAPDEAVDFVRSMYEELLGVLGHYGLTRIDSAPVFDARTQRIVGVSASPDQNAGAVLRVVRAGYSFEGSVLRPEEVIVADAGEAGTDA